MAFICTHAPLRMNVRKFYKLLAIDSIKIYTDIRGARFKPDQKPTA